MIFVAVLNYIVTNMQNRNPFVQHFRLRALPGMIREFRGLLELPRLTSRSELLDFSRSGDFRGLLVDLAFALSSKCSDLDFGMAGKE